MKESSQPQTEFGRIAVVDCGTNLFTMLVAQANSSGWQPEFVLRRPVFIGQGGFQSRNILSNRFARGLDALRVLHQAAMNYGVNHIRVIGTSALRDAHNGQDFATRVQRELGWNLEVISGEQEARWIQFGVALTLEEVQGPVLIMDIGGGSVEFIVTDRDAGSWTVLEWMSLDIGVGRLEEFGKPTDPLTTEGEQRYTAYLTEVLAPVRKAIERFNPRALVGSSGSFDTFADLLHESGPPVPASIPNGIQKLERHRMEALHAQLISLPLDARLKLHGMAPSRARLIPLSSMLVQHVVRNLPSDAEILRSPYALREGVMQTIWQHLCSLNDSPTA